MNENIIGYLDIQETGDYYVVVLDDNGYKAGLIFNTGAMYMYEGYESIEDLYSAIYEDVKATT